MPKHSLSKMKQTPFYDGIPKNVFFDKVLLILEDIFDAFERAIFKIKMKHRAFERSKIGKSVQ